MGTRVRDRVEQWDRQSFDGGYSGLRRLADREFSGIVRGDGAELVFSSGVAVAVRGGDIGAFEAASGTIHEAPSPALPLLAVMQERSEEVRDSFYTERTALSTVDETLSEGGFTGYVELSENVLSGDYYVVYHAGASMTVAFVGQSERLVDGDEAFQAARDEVGIYQVRPVEIDPVDLPGPEPDSSAGTTPGDRPTASSDRQEGETGDDADTAEDGTEDVAEGATAAGRQPTGDGEDAAGDGAAGAAVRTIPSLDPARSDGGGLSAAEPATEDGEASTGDQVPLEQRVRDLEREREKLRDRLDSLRSEFAALRARLDETERVDAEPSDGDEP